MNAQQTNLVRNDGAAQYLQRIRKCLILLGEGVGTAFAL
jgi:hypothetical protein